MGAGQRSSYGHNYSVRCLQASECIRSILAELGIQSRLLAGALCTASIYVGPPQEYGWFGFWGEDHHVWLVTEYAELIDLTIAQLHLHPAASRPDAYPIPAFWWHPIYEMPCAFKYLPLGPITIKLPPEEMEILDGVRNNAVALLSDEMTCGSMPKEPDFQIIYGIESLNQLCQTGHPWASQALIFQEMGFPLPPWVAQRESELLSRC